jgi:hypothetical protein
MGLPRVALSQALLLQGAILVEVVPTDGDCEDETDVKRVC